MKSKSSAPLTKDALLKALKPVDGGQTEGDRMREAVERLRRGDFTQDEVKFLDSLKARQEKRSQLTHLRGVGWADVLLELHQVTGDSVQQLMQWDTRDIDELIDAVLRQRGGLSKEEDGHYGKALMIWNNQPEITWSEIAVIMGGNATADVDALRTGVRRFANRNKLHIRNGCPGRPKKK